MKPESEFTPKETLFVAEFMVDLHGKNAAIRAGYSAKTAKTIANQLRRRPHIASAIGRAMAKRTAAIEVNATWVLNRLVEVEMLATADDDLTVRLKALDKIGQHVDVNAFRTQFGLAGPTGGAIPVEVDLKSLTEDELDLYERLLTKLARENPSLMEGLSERAPAAGDGEG